MFPQDIQRLAQQIVATSTARGLMLATAESCTGGLVAAALTAVPGSSAALDRGFVTYSNEAKQQMLEVPEDTLITHGAVSEPTARAMAQGAVARSRAAVSVAVTGIAGPGGGSAEKPVGLVHFAAQGPGGLIHRRETFGDLGRDAVRLAALGVALEMLADRLGS
ncbi:MAG: damage-inducible protein CinA [Caulobacterales bacterium RIFOXYB1_FULL_67_16]|nr:MAG: damage-inducible protein CinA [Caulobacterales bacterium RIFOXYB1_FULL_67_16]